MIIDDDNPYVGPLPLPRGRRIWGRDWEIEELADVVISERIALVYSPSGAGKSSLLNAGVVPYLEERSGFFVYPIVRLNHSPIPGVELDDFNRYIWSAAWSLRRDHSSDDTQEIMLQQSLQDALESAGPQGSSDGDDASGDDAPEQSKRRKLLIIDQAEELFSLDPTDALAKKAFVDAVVSATSDPYLFLIIAMREEYISQLEEYAPMVPLSARFRLDFLSLDAAEQAIREPARAKGVSFGDQLARDLALNLSVTKAALKGSPLQDIHGEVEPVQIQLVCRRMWRLRNPNSQSITKKDFPDEKHLSKAVNSALADYYSDVIDEVSKECEIAPGILRQWINTQLITTTGLRDQAWQGQLEEHGISDQVIEALQASHLIRSDKRGSRIFYELAHDRLLNPIRDEHQNWKLLNLQPFQLRAEAYEGGKEVQLLSRKEYLKAIKWQSNRDYSLTGSEKAFLNASRERLRRNRLLQSLSGVIVLGATIFVLQLEWQHDTLLRIREAELLQAQKAIEASNLAGVLQYTSQELEIVRRDHIEELRRRLGLADDYRRQFVRSTTTEAQLLAQVGEFSAGKLALSRLSREDIEVPKRSGLAFLDWYIETMGVSPSRHINYHAKPAHNLTSAAISETNDWLFLSGKYGHAYLVNRKSSASTRITEGVFFDWILEPVFYSDERRVLARNAEGKLLLWEFSLKENQVVHSLVESGATPNGRLISFSLAVDESDVLKVVENKCETDIRRVCWQVRRGPPFGTDSVLLFESEHRLIAAHELDSGLIVTGGEQNLYAIRADGDLVRSRGIPGNIRAFGGTEDERRLAIATDDGTVTIFSLSQETILDSLRTFNAGDSPVQSVTLLDHDFALVGSDDQKIRLIDIESGRVLRVLEGHTSAISRILRVGDNEILSVGPDGQVLQWRPFGIRRTQIVNLDRKVSKYCEENSCPIEVDSHAASAVALSPDLSSVFVGLQEGGFLEYSIAKEQIAWYQPEPSRSSVRDIAVSGNGRWLGIGDNAARTFDIGSQKLQYSILDFQLPVSAILFPPHTEGPTLLASSFDGRVAVANDSRDIAYYPRDPVNFVGNRNVNKDINSIAIDCVGENVITTTNHRPLLWKYSNGVLMENENREILESTYKILSATIWKSGDLIFDAGFVGMRRKHEWSGAEVVSTDLTGHFADVHKIMFGPYGQTLLSIDANGVLAIRDVNGQRDLLRIELPATNGDRPIEKTRTFDLRCTNNANGNVQDCMIVAPLGTRPGLFVMNLGSSLSAETLFGKLDPASWPESVSSCAIASR
jgi:WD40 repeat protein